MKKKKKGGPSKALEEGDSGPIVALVAGPSPIKASSCLSPDLEVGSACSGSDTEDDSCSEDDCTHVKELGGSPIPVEDAGVLEAVVGVPAAGCGNFSAPNVATKPIPKLGAWRSLFMDNRTTDSSTLLSLFTEVSESKSCILSDEDIPCDDWKRCLIGYIAGKYPGFTALKSVITNIWKKDANLTIHESGWLVYEFKKEEDKMDVLNGGPYLIYGRPLILKSMPEYFNFSKKEMSSVPVWIKLPNLPLKCWSIRSLSKISSLIGKPIQCDKLTVSKLRISYARVLIEVDLREDLPASVEIGLPNGMFIEQPVIYESLPQFCKLCLSIGHSSVNCGKPSAPTVRRNNSKGPVMRGEVPVVRNLTRAQFDGPVINRKSGNGDLAPANAGTDLGLTHGGILIGSKGQLPEKSVQVQSSQAFLPISSTIQQQAPSKEAEVSNKGKGKEVLEDPSEPEGLKDTGKDSSAIPIIVLKPDVNRQLGNADSKGNAISDVPYMGEIAPGNSVMPQGLEEKKTNRKTRKTAKGVSTSSAAK